MKTSIKTLVLSGVAALSFAHAASATSIDFLDSGPGTVEILASGLPAGEAVTSYDILVNYDANVTGISAVFNDAIYGAFGGFDGTFDSGTSLELSSLGLGSDADALGAQASSPILLATLTLLGAGVNSADLGVNWTTGGYEVTGVVDPTTGLPSILAPTSTNAPEPATLGLLGLALVGFGLARRRRVAV